MTFLLPAEFLDGTDAEQQQLRSLLSRLRSGPQPGGFHHPGQGYRHLQMTATITAYDQLTGNGSRRTAGRRA